VGHQVILPEVLVVLVEVVDKVVILEDPETHHL
jgi:predicted ATPase